MGDKNKRINEGHEKKGGLAKKPSAQKPKVTPPPRKPKKD
jgi:hypothetical protein